MRYDRDFNTALNLKRLATATALPEASPTGNGGAAVEGVSTVVGKVTPVRYDTPASGQEENRAHVCALSWEQTNMIVRNIRNLFPVDVPVAITHEYAHTFNQVVFFEALVLATKNPEAYLDKNIDEKKRPGINVPIRSHYSVLINMNKNRVQAIMERSGATHAYQIYPLVAEAAKIVARRFYEIGISVVGAHAVTQHSAFTERMPKRPEEATQSEEVSAVPAPPQPEPAPLEKLEKAPKSDTISNKTSPSGAKSIRYAIPKGLMK